MQKILTKYLKASYGALTIATREYHRCLEDIRAAVSGLSPSAVYQWDARGVVEDALKGCVVAKDMFGPESVLERVAKDADDARLTKDPTRLVWVLADMHLFGRDVTPVLVSLFREAVCACNRAGHSMILVGTDDTLPEEMATLTTRVQYALPDMADIKAAVERFMKAYDNKLTCDSQSVARAASGMSAVEIEDALAFAAVEGAGKIDPKTVMRLKAASVARSGCLSFVETNVGADDIGGLENLVNYLDARRTAFTPEARKFGCELPRGIMLLGPAGTGKSMVAKATAGLLDRSLLALDMGAVQGPYVGESAKNMREAIAVAEAMAPCVLYVDELEKGIGGGGKGVQDGGARASVLGTFLVWLNDHTSDVYVVATCNSVEGLPPELMRKGRFDELFLLELPTAKEREDIFRLHIAKRMRDPKNFDLRQLASRSEEFSGAEIEQAVVDAMYPAFNDGADLDTGYILAALDATKPLAKINPEQSKHLRDWGAGRCRMASPPPGSLDDTCQPAVRRLEVLDAKED